MGHGRGCSCDCRTTATPQAGGNLSISRLQPKGEGSGWILPQGKDLVAAPNPARGKVSLIFRLSGAARVELSLFDLSGAVLNHIDLGNRPAGDQRAELNLGGVANGIYFILIDADAGSGFVPVARTKLAVLQ